MNQQSTAQAGASRQMRKRKMPWWKALPLSVACAGGAVGVTTVYVRSWIRRRTERAWPAVVGTVRALENGPGFKGRPSAYLVGDYPAARSPHRFSVVWAACDWRDRAWIPPEGTPPVGSRVFLHADPSNPARVALDSNPTKHSTAHDVLMFALVRPSLIGTASPSGSFRP